MKIVIISELEYGSGAAIAAFRLAKALANLEHDIYYIVGQKNNHTERTSNIKTYLLGQHRRKNIRQQMLEKIYSLIDKIIILITHKHNKNPKILQKLRNYQNQINLKEKIQNNRRELQQLIETIKPDIINLHNISNVISHREILALKFQCPMIWTLHDCWPVTGYNYKFMNLQKELITTYSISPKLIDITSMNTLINSPKLKFIAPSQWLEHLVLDQLQEKKPVNLIPNGLSSTEFFPEDQRQARLDLGLDPEKFYLLLVASNLKYERKNTQIVLENLKKINELSIEVIALGEVDKNFSQKYPSIHLFKHTFNCQKIRQLYAVADIFLTPSLIDNLPNTVLESLFCGTPVVGANVGGIPEMVIEGKTGWLFDPYNADELIALLNGIYKQRQQLPQIRKQCFAWVQEHYSIEQQVQAYLQLFQTMITSSVQSIESKLKSAN